jgi:hypothetical protein
MKIFAMLAAILICNLAQASVDRQVEVTIVVENYHVDGEYFLRTVPADFCIGSELHSVAQAITMPVGIKSGYGCGAARVSHTQVNAATCAKINVDDLVMASPDIVVRKDLTKCGAKAKDKKFVETLDQAIRNSYIANGYNNIVIK